MVFSRGFYNNPNKLYVPMQSNIKFEKICSVKYYHYRILCEIYLDTYV